MRVIRSAPLLLLLLLLLTMAGTGCLFSPEKKPPKKKEPVVYVDPIAPGNVLLNMITAYVNKDEVQTALVYDDSYSGQSTDPSGLVGDFTVTKPSEVDHVKALRFEPSIIDITLDMGIPGAWQVQPALASDPPEWREIQINFATIQVVTNTDTYISKNQNLTYTFKPNVESPTRTTWKIIRWTEFVTNPPSP